VAILSGELKKATGPFYRGTSRQRQRQRLLFYTCGSQSRERPGGNVTAVGQATFTSGGLAKTKSQRGMTMSVVSGVTEYQKYSPAWARYLAQIGPE